MNSLFYLRLMGALWLKTTLSLLVELIVFVVFIILTFIDTNQMLFFWITIVLVVILNIGNGLYMSCVYSLLANLERPYIRDFIFGRDICGIIVSLVNIFSIWVTPEHHHEGLIYFSFAVGILSICLLTNFYVNSKVCLRRRSAKFII